MAASGAKRASASAATRMAQQLVASAWRMAAARQQINRGGMKSAQRACIAVSKPWRSNISSVSAAAARVNIVAKQHRRNQRLRAAWRSIMAA